MLAVLGAAALLLISCGEPERSTPARQLGRNALEEGRFDLARKYLEAAVGDRPDDIEACTLFARSWSSGTMQNPSLAIEAWQRCSTLEPSSEASLGIAQGHFWLGAYEQAVVALDGIEESAASTLLRGRSLLHLDSARAMREISAAVTHYPDHAQLRKLAAQAAHLVEDFQTASVHLARALELDPLDGKMHYLDGRTRQQMGDTDGAEAAFERQRIASRISGSGGWPEAPTVQKVQLLEQLGVRTPATDVASIEWLIEIGRRTEAVEVAERLLNDADATPSNLLRAEAAIAGLRRFDLAHSLLDRVQREDPDAGRMGEGSFRRALLLHQQGNPAAALAEVDTVLAADPWVARFFDLRARVHAASGDDDAAAEDLARALDLAPWRIDSRLGLAEIELRHGRQNRARALLSEAPEPSPAINEFRRRHDLE